MPDWRKIQGSKMLDLGNKLKPLEDLELPMKDVQLEHKTLYAAMLELEIRFQDDIKFMIVPHQVFVSLSSPEGIQADYGGENERFIQGIRSAKHVFVAFKLLIKDMLIISYS